MKFIKTVTTDAGDKLKLERETDSAVEQNQLISQGWEVADDAKGDEKPTLPAPPTFNK
uniref:Uncharacterized protein n=1 Tax=Siphoviridae sp. ctXof7 TaxID=2827888 RepID=A0A8S5SHT9_9CAUD|nr:MAG TPA: hypothetical protein [Siphoviridae sp. ctXof7]